MIQNLKEKFKKYRESKSTLSIISDVVFVLILIALLIPPSRQYLVVGIKKATMMQPRIEVQKENLMLNDDDYQWTFQKADGELVNFEDYKGKVVFLSFWATYCPSCIAEFSSIKNLFEDYKQEVDFLLISGEGPEKVKSFLQKEQYNIPFYLTYSNLPEKLKSRQIPATFIIAKDGSLVLHKTGAARWDGQKTRTLLNTLIEQ